MTWPTPKFASKSDFKDEIELKVGKELVVDMTVCHTCSISKKVTLTSFTSLTLSNNTHCVIRVTFFASFLAPNRPRAQPVWSMESPANSIKFFLLFGLGGSQSKKFENIQFITNSVQQNVDIAVDFQDELEL